MNLDDSLDNNQTNSFAAGMTLPSWRKQFPNGVVPVDKAVAICKQIASALDAAHSSGGAYGFIRPSCVLVDESKGTVAVSISNTVPADSASDSRFYLAPEQWKGEAADGKTDQYALACIFYELLSGDVPFSDAFETDDADLIRRAVVCTAPDRLPMLSKSAEVALMKALSKKREKRFESCKKFTDALSSGNCGGPRRAGFVLIGLAVFAGVAAVLAYSHVKFNRTEGDEEAEVEADQVLDPVESAGNSEETDGSKVISASELSKAEEPQKTEENGKTEVTEAAKPDTSANSDTEEDIHSVDLTEEDLTDKPKCSLVIPDNYPRICRRFATLVSGRHLLQKPLDGSVSAQAWTNYISYMDYDRSYFTQQDIDSFEPWRMKMTSDLQNGNLDFAIKVFETLKKRVSERTAYTKTLLETNFDFSVEESYTWKRKDLPWCKDAEEQNELWRKRIKNEILAKIVSKDYAVSNKTEKAEIAETNSVASVSSVSTNDAQSVTNSVDLSPEAFVRKRYEQYNIVIQDSDSEWLIQRYLNAFAAAYDPHSSYMAPAAVDDFNIDMNLTLAGIGATLTSEDGAAKIVEIIPGSPAARDTRDIRLRKNDKIIGVGQGDGPIEDIIHQPLSKIVKRIRGPKGTKVVLNVISASDPSGSTTRKVDIVRDDIKLEEQAATGRVIRVASKLPDGSTNGASRAFGYVHLPTFYGSMTTDYKDPNFRSCTFDIMKIVSRINPEIEGLILDLRGNGGGSLREAVTLAGSFIRMGPIVIVRELGNTSALPDRDPAIGFRKPMIVMVDRASASASEIVAAALQDYGRALIVGDHKTHGKGSVQTVMPLIAADESYGSLRLTCATFHRIDGGSTQLKGVESDIILPSTLEYLDIGEDKLPNAMPWTQVPPAHYRQVYALSRYIPTLRTNAMERLANDAEYQKHLRIVEHVRDVSERTSVPLCYKDRYELFEAEDKLNKAEGLESEDDGEDDDSAEEKQKKEPEDGIGKDIVLRATVDILKDLVDIQGETGISASADEDPSDWLFKFFK